MIAFERQQNILRLLREKQGIKITKMADFFTVSRGTIRNDLLILEEQGQIKRVRGGAVLLGEALTNASYETSTAEEAPGDFESKQRMARWAAELAEDGTAIFLGAGTTIEQMIPYLADKRDLNIITNGLETAIRLKQETDHTIILLGGVLLDHGYATGGLLNSNVLEHLNVLTAFVSGSGFTKESRITESTLEEAELKKKIVGKSLQTVVLMDSTKVGKVGRFPFADLENISHFYTDADVSADLMEQMRAANVNLMICGKNTFRSYKVSDNENKHTLGFANQSEELPFAIDVRRGLERAVTNLRNIDLVIADNKLSGQEALHVADKLIERNVDLAIEYQIDYTVGGQIMDKFQQANIPVIAVDIPMVGATFFGIDNYRAGHVAGTSIGRWLKRVWGGDFDKVLVLEEPRAGAVLAARIQGQLDGLTAIVGEIPKDKLSFLYSGNTSSISEESVYQAMQALPNCRRIAILPFNTDAATGALRAARHLGREQDVIIV